MNTLQELEKWYRSQCNGDWEHSYGIKVDTLDNPGWSVSIDLVDTLLAERSFTEVQRLQHGTEWIHCRIRDGKWEGYGGPFILEEILQIFLAWATESGKHDG